MGAFDFEFSAFDVDGDLYKMADAICAGYKQRHFAKYGNNVEFPSDLIMASFREARARMPKPEIRAEETTKPAPEDMIEGGGVYPSADELATIKAAAINNKNPDDAIRAISRSLGY